MGVRPAEVPGGIRGWRFRALWVAAALAVLPCSSGAPVVRSAMLRFGGSPRLPTGNWVYLNYEVANPDPTPVEVRLSLRAAERGRSVYEKTVFVEAGSVLRGREPVTADASEEYVLSLFVGDERIQRETAVVNTVDPTGCAVLLVLNDDPEFVLGADLGKLPSVREPVVSCSVKAKDSPTHWTGYGQVRAVVIGRPAYADLSAVQFGALAGYVEHGGSVLFASPEGTLEAAGTPWAALLPVVPLRVRLAEELPEFDAWAAEAGPGPGGGVEAPRRPLADRDGFPVLESTPCGEGLTVLGSAFGPLIRWRRWGLGRVGVAATDPRHERISESGLFVPFWNHVLCYTQPVFALGNIENSHALPTVLGHLTGFRIPRAGVIGAVLAGYLVCLSGILAGGFLRRRHQASWALAGAMGVLLTGVLLVWAYHQNPSRAANRAAILNLEFWGERRSLGHAVVSLFSSRDLRLLVTSVSSTCQMRSLPSPARGKRREPLDAPLVVDRKGDLACLPSIAVQALRPREFGAEYELLPRTLQPLRLTLNEHGVGFAPGQGAGAAAISPSARLFLLVGEDLAPIDRDRLQGGPLESRPSLVQGDPFLEDLRRYLTQAALPRPALVAVQRWEDAPGGALPVRIPGFSPDGYTVRCHPVALAVAPGPVRVPPELLRLESARLGGRLLARLVESVESTTLRAPRTVLVYDVVLPPALADLLLDQVRVELDLANAGGNLTADARLARVPVDLGAAITELDAAALWDRGVPAAAVEGGEFRFSGAAVTRLVVPRYARFRLLVQLSQKQRAVSAQDADRLNRWRINRLRVALEGTVPPADETRTL